MLMRNCSRFTPFAVLAAAVVLPLLLSGCAGRPERMTRAALRGDVAATDDLLKPGSSEIDTPFTMEVAEPACPGQKTLTPLQAAACAGQEAVVRRLLAGKADIDLAAGARQPPLVLAMKNGRYDVVRLLVQSGASVEGGDPSGNTALILGAAKGERALAEFLLKNGASPKGRNQAGETALLQCADAELAKTLADLGSDPLAVNAGGETGLHLAARNGNAGMARFFLERGVDVGLRNSAGATALDIARGNAPAAPSMEGGQSAVRSRRGRGAATPAGGPTRDAGADSAGSGAKVAVVAVLEEWIGRAIGKEVAAGDQAAQGGRSPEAMGLYVAALSKACDLGATAEQELRVKIVRYAASLSEPFGLPEPARERIARTSYLIKKGGDIGAIENEMVAALRIAPWWADGYFNLGQIQAEQNKFDSAERNLNLFISAAVPDDPRVRTAQDKVYEIRMGREEEGKVRGMAGRWTDGSGTGYDVSIDGDRILLRSQGGLSFTLNNRSGTLEGTVTGQSSPGAHGCTIPGQTHPVNGKLATDARGITLEYLWSRYQTKYHCVNMAGQPSNCCLLCDEVCDAVTVSATDQVSLKLKPAR